MIGCSEIVTRILANAKHVDENGNVTAAAFILRANDQGKLSVFRQSMISVEESKTCLKKAKGAVSLHTGHIRNVNQTFNGTIDVLAADFEGTHLQGHAALVGLPGPLVNVIESERVATLLRDQSRKAD